MVPSEHKLLQLSNWLWKERNGGIFKNPSMDCSSLQGLVTDNIRACLSSWRGVKASSVAAAWRVTGRIFPPNAMGL